MKPLPNPLERPIPIAMKTINKDRCESNESSSWGLLGEPSTVSIVPPATERLDEDGSRGNGGRLLLLGRAVL